jgi:hypothetical protein
MISSQAKGGLLQVLWGFHFFIKIIEFDFHKGFKKGSFFLQNILFYVFGHWGMVSIIYLLKKNKK